MKSWNIPADFNNNGQNVDEGQHRHRRIALMECFNDKKCDMVFGINKTRETSKLLSLDQSALFAMTKWPICNEQMH